MAVRTFVFDLDGVIYRGEQPLPGAVDTIKILRQLGHQVYFFTNNATQTRTSYIRKLSHMGIPVDKEHIMTSAYATALYLISQGAKGSTAYVVGEQGLKDELESIGVEVVSDVSSRKVDYVIAGLDRKFTYDKLMKAQQAIFHGAKFIATNRDTTFPLEEGLIVPGGGALVSAIEAATDTEPIVIGKPETTAMREIFELANAQPSDAVVVGDRLDTDILAGRRTGAVTVLVLTGITTLDMLESAPPEMLPDIVVKNLMDMLYNEQVMGDSILACQI
ncbi:MAG: HAD-IIA family hydrolase [Armatimonadota bacterium]